jgi:hypothetical protein
MILLVSEESRKLAHSCIYVVLAFSALCDGGLGEGAISGCCDVGYVRNPTWGLVGTQPELWPWIAGFIVLQAMLILAVFRLRDPNQANGLSLSESPPL